MRVGASMQLVPTFVRFARQGKGGRHALSRQSLNDRIVEVRRLLRTDASIGEMAAELGTSPTTLYVFIRHRRLCNMKERHRAIQGKKLEPLE